MDDVAVHSDQISVEYNVTIASALGVAEETYHTQSVATVEQLLHAIKQHHGDRLHNAVIDRESRLLPSVLVAVNGQQPAQRDASPLRGGDRVLFLSVVGGG